MGKGSHRHYSGLCVPLRYFKGHNMDLLGNGNPLPHGIKFMNGVEKLADSRNRRIGQRDIASSR